MSRHFSSLMGCSLIPQSVDVRINIGRLQLSNRCQDVQLNASSIVLIDQAVSGIAVQTVNRKRQTLQVKRQAMWAINHRTLTYKFLYECSQRKYLCAAFSVFFINRTQANHFMVDVFNIIAKCSFWRLAVRVNAINYLHEIFNL